jgi:hypothetical protein
MPTPVGTKLELRSPQYERIEAAVIDAWSHGRPYTQAALAQAIGCAHGLDPEDVAVGLVYYLRQLASRGMYEAQAGRFGSKGTMAKGSPTSPRWFNWSGVPLDQATLRHIVEPYLADAEVEEWRKEGLRKALRFRFDLSTRCGELEIIAAAERVSADHLYGLPGAVLDQAKGTLAHQTAKNYRSAIVHMLTYGGTKRLVPMVFPYLVEQDHWALAVDKYFPLPEKGPADFSTRNNRQGMREVGKAARHLFGDDVTLEVLTRAQAKMITDDIRYRQGKLETSRLASRALLALSRKGTGPLTTPRNLDAFTVDTPYGPKPSIYLRHNDGTVGGNDWGALLELLTAKGLPDETVAWLREYGHYITMPSRELFKSENRKKYPVRLDKHYLQPTSMVQRATALRAYLGAAIELAGYKPEELTLDVIFGTDFDNIAYSLMDWWQERRAAALEDGEDMAISGALGHYIISIGMICYTRYTMLRHQRRLKVTTRTTGKNAQSEGTEHVDVRAEEKKHDKSLSEQAAFDAYIASTEMEARLGSMVKRTRGTAASSAPEFKNLKRMMENTPPEWFITVLNAGIEEVRVGMRRGRNDLAFHEQVLDVIDIGLTISTGSRSEESCLVRIDRHLTPENRAARRFTYRAEERKQGTPHEVLLQPAYMPDDILDFYLNVTRPYLMKGQWTEERRRGARGITKSRPDKVQEHPFFLVNTTGAAYGVEDLESEESLLVLRTRAATHGRSMLGTLTARAVACGLTVPRHKRELGPHAIRGVFAYALYLVTGSISAAAHYLGDTEETAAAAYSRISGVHVDSSSVIGFDVSAQISLVGALQKSNVVQDDEFIERMEELRKDRRDGVISDEAYTRLVEAYTKRYGLAA